MKKEPSQHEPLNAYGDSFTPTDDGRGVDISSQRQDELDKGAVAAIAARVQERGAGAVAAVDLGGGFGAHSIRMAQAGAKVTMIDLADMAQENFAKAVESGMAAAGSLEFIQKDFSAIAADDVPEGFDVLYSQRAIHYVPYQEAKAVLRTLFNRMAAGGEAFISAAGWDTEYGKTYPDRDKPVEERFAYVTQDMQEKHGITHKIVTYTEQDMAKLLADTGFEDVQVTRSTFGNIKASAKKPAL
ncbi:MAG: methyltransferase domain-containing protein [Alphaproteobacteria bacterium]|nr:methyltransferase domain-containing protein [Alphaproteobacteria bacterium]